jgi:hypothetical protein
MEIWVFGGLLQALGHETITVADKLLDLRVFRQVQEVSHLYMTVLLEIIKGCESHLLELDERKFIAADNLNRPVSALWVLDSVYQPFIGILIEMLTRKFYYCPKKIYLM